jgi:HSP20 family protein
MEDQMDRETSGKGRTTEDRYRTESEEEREGRMGAANVTGRRDRGEQYTSREGTTGMDRGAWTGERGVTSERSRAMMGYSPSAWESPVTILQHMSEEMDRLFDIFFHRGMGPRSTTRSSSFLPSTFASPGTSRSMWAPELDIYEDNGELKILADLPGLKKEDVQIEFRDGMLIIEGERRDVTEDKTNGFRRTERHYGKFYRTVMLPEGVNPDEAKARFKNGELEITLPAPKRPMGRRLDIEAEDR